MSEGTKLQRAEKIRKEYVNRLKDRGIQLKGTSSRVVFRTDTGKVVGMPSAAFDIARGPEGGWWMGLPNEYFDFIIFLCQRDTETPLDFVLPHSFFSVIWRDDLYWQYQTGGWQVKFDVRRSGDIFELKLKGRKRAPENIKRFLGYVEVLTE